MNADNKKIINDIKNIEDELLSFDNEIKESSLAVESEKKKIIKIAKSGEFEEMLSEIENRQIKKKNESFISKLFRNLT
jgi:hypothetical protein